MIASPQRFIEPFSKILKAIGDLRMALGFCGAQPCLSAIANGLLDLQMQLTVPAASAHALLETVEKRISEFSESFLNVENFCTSEKTSELFFEISQQFIDILANLKTTVGTNTFSQQMAAVPAVPAAKKEESYAPTEYNETPRETPREEKSSATPKRERKYRAPAQHDKPPVIYIEPQPSTLRRLWIKIGASSLSISLLIHSLLLLCAGLVVTTIYNAQTVTENLDTFATGAGGGREGKDVSFERRVKLKRPVPQRPSSLTKITARTASSVTLPDIPNLDRLLIKQSGEIGKISKGSGTGAGGGIGDGIGPGRGGRNMVGMFKPQFVMGVKIHSGNGRVAVYLDNSGSMVPFLDGVKREIRSKFPDADIFEHDGIVTVVQNGKVVGGREFTNLRLIRQRNKFLPEGTTNKTKLSAHGKAVFAKYATNFDDGSVGAWADIMQHDNYYGALVIFSDFQDGIRIVNSRGESVETTTKTANSWDERWVRQFAGALTGAAPKLYLFSIQRKPQEVWQRCVEASGGEIKMMPELRSGGDFIGGAIGAPIEAPATGKVRWTDKLAAAKGEAKSKKKNLLLLFTASGNSACQTLQDNVLNTAKFEDAVESKYITVKFDCTKSFHHRDLRTKYSVTEFPTIVLTTPDGTVIKHITGNAATSLQELISNL